MRSEHVEVLRDLRDRLIPAALRHHASGPGYIEEAQEIVSRALAQQPAYDGGFSAADMMDARQEGRKEAQQQAERMAEALRPLAVLDLTPDGFDARPDDQIVYQRNSSTITVGDVRRAAAALRDHDKGESNAP